MCNKLNDNNNIITINCEQSISENTDHNIEIIFLNAQGIKREIKKQELEILLNDNLKTDFLCIAETWLSQEDLAVYSLNNFALSNSYSRKSGSKGGVAIFSQKQFITTPIDLNFITDDKVFEATAIKIAELNIILVTIYRTPDAEFDDFPNRLNALLNKLSSKKNKLVVAGDFNKNFISTIQLSACRDILSVFESFNMKPIFNEPTRICKTSETCIDQIFSNVTHNNHKTVETGFSDHRALYCSISMKYKNKLINSKYCENRIYSKNNKCTFLETLEKEDWTTVYAQIDTNSKMENFMNIVTGYFSDIFKKTKTKIRTERKSKWITKGILKSRETKIWLNEIRKNDISGFINDYFKKYNRIYKKIILSAKKMENDSFICKASNISKASWAIVRRETNNHNTETDYFTLSDNGLLHKDPVTVANMFNNYFLDVPIKLSNDINLNYAANSSHSDCMPDVSFDEDELVLYPCDSDELISIIKSRKNSFASGIDEMPDSILKMVSHTYVDVLSHIINFSFQEGTFPNILKISKVRPLHKKGSKTNVNNFRPLSNQSFFSKIFELTYRNRLNGFLHAYNLISPHQHGFTKGRSTCTALNNFIKKILNGLDKGDSVLSIYTDQSRAFDCVPHDRLFNKLKSLGIKNVALNWIKSYLCQRSQVVEVPYFCNIDKCTKYKQSNSREITLGTQQGSILAPDLFALYINDLPNYVSSDLDTLYADDYTAVISDKFNKLKNKADVICNRIDNWFNCNKLSLNSDKTQAMRFSLRPPKNIPPNIILKKSNVQYVDNCKFLGVIVDERLNWTPHINKVEKSLNSVIYLLRILKDTVSTETLWMVYYGKIYSLLSYCCTVWGQGVGWERIFKCQKKAIRTIIGKFYDSTTHMPISCRPYFKNKGLLTFPSIYIYNCLQVALRDDSLNTFGEIHNTRNNSLYRLESHNTSAYARTAHYVGAKIYNVLPSIVRKTSHKETLQCVKKYLIDNAFYSLDEFYAANLI